MDVDRGTGLKLPAISLKTVVGDCCGGLIAALIALPYGLAMATLMGLPPLLGVFSSLLTAPITALIGRNPVLIGGTSSVTVPIIALAARQQGVGGAAKVTLVGAVFMLTFSVLHWGRFISKVPHAVVSGFSCGIGDDDVHLPVEIDLRLKDSNRRRDGFAGATVAGVAAYR